MFQKDGREDLGKGIRNIVDKMCQKCRQFKATKNFNKSSRSPDGFQGYCRDCNVIYMLEMENDYRGEKIKYAHRDKELIRKNESIIKAEQHKVRFVYDDQQSQLI